MGGFLQEEKALNPPFLLIKMHIKWGISLVSSRKGFLQYDDTVDISVYVIGLFVALEHIVVRAWGNQITFKDCSRL